MGSARSLLLVLLLHASIAAACSDRPLALGSERPPAPPLPEGALVVDFETATAGETPAGFNFARTGRGGPGIWQILGVSGAPSGTKVLAQTSTDATGYRFPLAVYESWSGRDVDLAVSFHPVAGRVDQAAGLVWRYRDADNYYVVRANALEDNVVLYKVEAGKRVDLDVKGERSTYGVQAEVPSGAWSELRVIARGSRFTVYLNGAQLFEVEDATFTDAGGVGLWTKADSVTHFDDLRIAGLPGGGP